MSRSNEILPEKIKEHMLKYIPTEGIYKRTEVTRRINEYSCLYVREKEMPGRWSQADSCMSMQAGCVSFLSGPPPHPPCRGGPWSVCVYTDWKWQVSSYNQEEPPKHLRREAKGHSNTAWNNENKSKKTMSLLSQYHFTPPCAQYTVF